MGQLGTTVPSGQGADQSRLLDRLRTEARARSGARWFYWIAGLSLVNSIAMISGSNFTFVVGLGVTQFADGIVRGMGLPGPTSFLVDIPIAAIFAMFGYFALQRHKWAYLVGMGLYACDGLIFLFFKDYLALAFHVYALWWIFKGMQAADELRGLEPQPAAAPIG